MKKTLIFVLIWMIIGFPLVPNLVFAAEFNPHYILSDEEFFDTREMDVDDIQNFLENYGSFLATYQTPDAKGNIKYASRIIFEASEAYGINPKVLLTLLQKEQSLIESSNPSTYNLVWATGFSRCDSCAPDDPMIQKYKGFGIQVDRAAWRLQYYGEHPNEFSFHIDESHLVDGITVIPVNQATVNLYNYTPHLHGNENFRRIWQRYFVKEYPDGALLQAKGSPGVWLIQQGIRRPFFSRSALLSRFDLRKIIQVNPSDIEKYEAGIPIKFPQYSLLRSPGGTVYLIDGDFKRGIVSRDAFRAIGFNPEEIINVSWDDLGLYKEGTPIREESIYPMGALLQNRTTGGIYYTQESTKHPIFSKEIFLSRFKNAKLLAVTEKELESFDNGEPILFAEGELVTAPEVSEVFIISNGTKRPFASRAVFETLGYQWGQIITTTKKILDIHPTGPIIFIHDEDTDPLSL